MMSKLSAVFIGNGSLLVRCATEFMQAGNEILAVASGTSDILDWARESGIGGIDLRERRASEIANLPDFDVLFSVAYLEILPPAVIRKPRSIALNFHDALLPRYAGLHTTSWALIEGERVHGVTWHEITDQVDAGRIAEQHTVEIAPDETALSLNAKCYEAGATAFSALLGKLAAGRLELTQQQGARTLYRRSQRPGAAANLDFTRPAWELASLVRGLDFGPYENPLALPKLFIGGEVLTARSAEALRSTATAVPGTILESTAESVRISTRDGDIVLKGLATVEGAPVDASQRPELARGRVLPALPADIRARMEAVLPAVAVSEPVWKARLPALATFEIPYPHRAANTAGQPPFSVHDLRASSESPASVPTLVAGFVAWLSRLAGQEQVSVRYADAALGELTRGLGPWVNEWVPLTLATGTSLAETSASVQAEVEVVRRAGPFMRDLPKRFAEGPRAAAQRVPSAGVLVVDDVASSTVPAWAPEVLLIVDARGQGVRLAVDSDRYEEVVRSAMARHLGWFLGQVVANHAAPLSALSLLPPDEQALVSRLNATDTAYADHLCIHQAFAEQVARTPDSVALACGDDTLTYRELDQRSTALAARLAARGVAPGSIVGLCLERSLALVEALIGIHKAGCAYLPLDPAYPADRIRFMREDAGIACTVTSRDVAERLGIDLATAVLAEDEAAPAPDFAAPAVSPASLAYVIYTSGSTGKPKGVMVTHRNVMNFFAGMDQRIPHDVPGTWLAVTSLSFDISVLELCWTLCRGFKVVLHADAPAAKASCPKASGKAQGPAFSLFYFSSDEASQGADKYRLLIEGSKFADREGFEAVWTPERHFHAFGGLYPNPAITGAAVAMVTQRVAIRAGSSVLPLHHPISLAEDWALVDNLSNGRVGVSFAAGWQPNDFVINPDNFARRRDLMIEGVDVVRRLWRGETVSHRNPNGTMVDIQTLPRPVQKELPIWLTAAGNPETFRQAGELGCHILTHLLGQSVEDVAEKIRLYHVAWREAGHKGQGRATLMLHTFVGQDEDAVREAVRGPMKDYLRSSVDLIRQAAWSFPTFADRKDANGVSTLDMDGLSADEMEALLEHAFARYYTTSGLFGTPESCAAIVRKLKQIGVDEIACLVDFGVPTDQVLTHLPYLKQVMDLSAADGAVRAVSIPEEIAAHRVTHFQCTPSMASMLVADAAGRAALAKLQVCMIGGEAMPMPLATELRRLVPGKLLNMYGPTETTIWSSTQDLSAIGSFIPLGTPIANTSLHVVNAAGQECPSYVPGELLIGGDGVTDGYLGRPELTAERFIPDAFAASPGAKLYRTGDLVRRHPDGSFEFLGRIDHQVKIRGHRVELGEIESAVAHQPGVRDAVVLMREDDAAGPRLVAYVTSRAGASLNADIIRRGVAENLPEIMVPAIVMVLPAMPLTPNGKIDRRALPAPRSAIVLPAAAPESDSERTIAAIWCELLGTPSVGLDENFFDLGGHSLLMVQVQRRLKDRIGREVAITDMFRFPTVRGLSAHLSGAAKDAAVDQGLARASARKAMLLRRQGVAASHAS